MSTLAMSPRWRPSAGLSYGLAVCCVDGAWVVSALLPHLMVDVPPWYAFVAVVLISIWGGGLGPGRLAGLLSTWNRGAEAMDGWTTAAALGKVSPLLLQSVLPQPLEHVLAELLRHERWEGELIHTGRTSRRPGKPSDVCSGMGAARAR
jgi:hypothetical protein